MDKFNDNNLPDHPGGDSWPPDAHGQSAMLLVESLIHDLIARSVFSVDDAMEIVNIAADVREVIAVDQGQTPLAILQSRALLDGISKSLQHDILRP